MSHGVEGAVGVLGSFAKIIRATTVFRRNSASVKDHVSAEKEALSASGLFDSAYYLKKYEDVAKSGIDPVLHYLLYGAQEGRWPNECFDSSYYLKANKDVAAARKNPLLHFATHGWKELRNPCSEFDTAWYLLTQMSDVSEAYNPLAHYLSEGRTRGLSFRSTASISPADRRRIDIAVRNFLAQSISDEKFCLRLGAYLVGKRIFEQAELVYRKLVGLHWGVARYHERLAWVLAAQGRRWQEVESLTTATALDQTNAAWYYRLGRAQEAMERWESSASSYRKFLSFRPQDSDANYRLGYALERLSSEDSSAHYDLAIAFSRSNDAVRYGIGVFHQKEGRWGEAARAYAQRLNDEPLDAELYYRLGMAYDRSYRWLESEKAYENAIALNPNVAAWHYRLGFVRERMRRWEDAAEAYQVAFEVGEQVRPYWQYRRGYVLTMAGDYQRACAAFIGKNALAEGHGALQVKRSRSACALAVDMALRALEKDFTRPDWHYQLAMQYEMLGEWCMAATAYRNAVDRKDEHVSEWYSRLGYALYRSGEYKSASESFRETRIPRAPYGLDSRKHEERQEDMRLLSYKRYLSDLPLRQRTVLYQSFDGVSIGCNPLAIFNFLQERTDFADWTHVWVVDSRNRIPCEYKATPNIIFVVKDSDLYLRYVATASHLINNSTFPSWFVRRDGQKYLNTWHGTPLKTLGRDIKGNFMERKNTARNFLQATHIISPNPHTTEVLVDRYDVSGILPGKVAETGYPRVDLVLNASEERRANTRKRLGLVPDLPVVLYAPTWRGVLGSPVLDRDMLRRAVEALAGLPCQVVFRGHYYSEQLLEGMDVPVTVAPYAVDTSELLALADVLVTDYSSILFDYLPKKRPIIYFAYDLLDYQEKRGLYFDMEEMPGHLCVGIGDLVDAVSSALVAQNLASNDTERVIERFCPHDDGSATVRVIDFFFNDSDDHVVPGSFQDARRKNLLIYAGAFPPQGITSSCLNLLSAVDPIKYRVVLVIDAAAVEKSQLNMQKFLELPPGVQVIARAGRMLVDPEEQWLIRRLNADCDESVSEMWDIYFDAHTLEFRRLFGEARFDGVIQFDGYSKFWTAILLGANADSVNAIYLHNDMREESEIKFTTLRALFKMYRKHDALVSVSEAMSNTNLEKLSSYYGIEKHKFVYAENVINHEEIVSLSSKSLDDDIARFMSDGDANFLAIGRMSPEKDHPKLIRAFKLVNQVHPRARLVLLGDGPLRPDIEQLVRDLSLSEVVFLAGQRRNPFPALKAADCFVLSSNHEGQPMVLLEALTLGKSIVATDIDGNRGALLNRGGMLVQNSDKGLAEGMLAFIEGSVAPPRFDPEDYRRIALGHFDALFDESSAHVKNATGETDRKGETCGSEI